MCLFQVLVPLGTTIVTKVHFSRHAPRGGLSLLLKSTRSFHQISWFSSLPSGPVLLALLVLCSHAILQLWPCGVHMGQRTPRYPVPRSKNAQMPEDRWGLTPYLSVCWLSPSWGGQCCFNIPLRDRISKNNFNNQLAPEHAQGSWRPPSPSFPLAQCSWCSGPWGSRLWQSSCQHFGLDCSSVWCFRAGVEGGCTHSGLGKTVQEKTKGNSYNWWCGFEISTKSRVAE